MVLEDNVEKLPAFFLSPLVAGMVGSQELFSKSVGLLPLVHSEEHVAFVIEVDKIGHYLHGIQHAAFMKDMWL